MTQKLIVEFSHTVRAVEREGELNLLGCTIARVWKETKRGKPFISLVGDDLPDVIKVLGFWNEAGQPSMDAAKAQAS